MSTSPPTSESTGPEHARQLGRSRLYTALDLSTRLRHWHAPRINRWERVRVDTGTLDIEYLGAAGITAVTLAPGETRWFAPGTRWRVAHLPAGGQFAIEVHADAKGQAEAPQPLRSDLLDTAVRVHVASEAEFRQLLDALPIGERRIVTAKASPQALAAVAVRAACIFWHPLNANANAVTALIARARTPFDLASYLGRDHAVIEATLGGALAGDNTRDRWLRSTLERHLQIEERLVFPAYLQAGGREAWVKGLLREHVFLRRYLGELDQPLSRRHFLRLLDGHDEKEERAVYPDILMHLGNRAGDLLAAAMAQSVAPDTQPVV